MNENFENKNPAEGEPLDIGPSPAQERQEPPTVSPYAPQQPLGASSPPPSYYNPPGGYHQPQRPVYQPPQPYQFNNAQNQYSTMADKSKGKPRNRGLMVFSVIIALIFMVSVAGFAVYGVYTYLQRPGQDLPILPPSESQSSSIDSNGPLMDIENRPNTPPSQGENGMLTGPEVVRRVAPSVVGITVYTQATGNFSSPVLGSGVIMSADGYIVTNAHVVEGGEGISVNLQNGDSYEARLVGIDTRTDLAVIKIDGQNLPFATFGNSDQLEIGESVLAIGNPAGLDGSVTGGLISAKDRSVLYGTGSYSITCLQTDAAISPGISGGALVNMYGQVVGIPSAKLASEGVEGIGFAIPINNAKPIVDDLVRNGRVTGRVRLGINAQVVDDATAAYNHVVPGLRIISTTPGTDIANKGAQPGDIITKVDGEEVKSLDDLGKVLDGKKVGDSVTLDIYRPANNRQASSTYSVSVRVISADE